MLFKLLLIVTWIINLRDPGPIVEGTEDVSIGPGHRLIAGDEEAPAAAPAVLLQGPAVRAVVGVLGPGQAVAGQHAQGDQGVPHYWIWRSL